MNASFAKQHRRLDKAIQKIFPPIKASATDVAWHLTTYLAIVLGKDGGRVRAHGMIDAIYDDLEAGDDGGDRAADTRGVAGDTPNVGSIT